MDRTVTSFHVSKRTGTHGDVFAAVGLARLLAEAVDGEPVQLIDTGIDFAVELPRELREPDLAKLGRAPGYPFLKANSKVVVPEGAMELVDYQAERAKVERRVLARQSAGKDGRQAMVGEVSELPQQDQLRGDWRLLQVLNSLRGYETSNRLHAMLVQRQPAALNHEVRMGLSALARGEPSGLKWPVTLVQLFTPTAAKGYGRLKPDGTNRNDKTKEQWSDPFVEWLKYRGYFASACPFFHGPKREHIRLVCPIPRNVSIRALEKTVQELGRSRIGGGPPKIDSLAVLRLAELLIRHSEEYAQSEEELFAGHSIAGRTPADVIAGVLVTNYQSLGQSRAVSAMASLGLPGWFPLRTRDDAEIWLQILDEHQRVLRGLQDDHSDEIGLLLQYRCFLELRGQTAIWGLIEFIESYGPFLIRAREQKRRLRGFRADFFRRIVMETEPRLGKVLDDGGFRAVAAAVRKATVSAQGQKAMGRPNYREIRYDLLPELRRKRSLPGGRQLIEAVADFISLYNTENARRRETGKPAPRNVTTEEFTGFIRLVESEGASTVGALLCAYGSCRETRDDEAAEPTEAHSEPNEAGLATDLV